MSVSIHPHLLLSICQAPPSTRPPCVGCHPSVTAWHRGTELGPISTCYALYT